MMYTGDGKSYWIVDLSSLTVRSVSLLDNQPRLRICPSRCLLILFLEWRCLMSHFFSLLDYLSKQGTCVSPWGSVKWGRRLLVFSKCQSHIILYLDVIVFIPSRRGVSREKHRCVSPPFFLDSLQVFTLEIWPRKIRRLKGGKREAERWRLFFVPWWRVHKDIWKTIIEIRGRLWRA
jgi:hypothetical protein